LHAGELEDDRVRSRLIDKARSAAELLACSPELEDDAVIERLAVLLRPSTPSNFSACAVHVRRAR
jgi:hypothetical protein